MATTTKKSSTKSTATKSAASESKATVEPVVEKPVAGSDESGAVAASSAVEQASIDTTRSIPPKKAEVSLNDVVYVQSCFHGNLFYQSKRNGSIVEWQRFGEDQPMDVDELMYMRNTQPTFFKEQWIRLVGNNADDVFEFLHLDRYCKNNLKFDDFDDVFEMEPDEIETVIQSFSPSLRESFARRALELIEGGELDNLKKIQAIERASGYSLLK